MSSKNIYTHIITENQRKEFAPTWLYIKYHSITGLSYFGKTTRNPHTYKGSGPYWRNHIRKHNINFVETLWCHLFTNIDELVEYALWFSGENDIVECKLWANRVFEDGLGGRGVSGEGNGMYGKKHTPESREKISQARKFTSPENYRGEHNGMYGKTGDLSPMYGKTHTPESKLKISKSKKGKTYEEIYGSVEKAQEMKIIRSIKSSGRIVSDETRKKLSDSLTGKLHTEERRLNNSKAQKGLQAGAKNPRALKIKAISPDGEIFHIHGEFKKFCVSKSLSPSTAGNILKYNRMPISGNCIGWSFYYE